MTRNFRWLPMLILLALSVACRTGAMPPPEQAVDPREPIENDRERLEQRAQILYAEAQGRLTQPLISALQADGADNRAAAVRAIGRIQPDDDRIDALLDDPAVMVRAAAWFASLNSGRPPQTEKVETAIAKEPPVIREAMARAFGLRQNDADAVWVLRLLADEDPDVQMAAAFAASRQPQPSRVIPGLTEWTRKGPPEVQFAAVWALASLARQPVGQGLDRITRGQIRRTLVSLSEHGSANVRVQVARGLDVPESKAARVAIKALTADVDLRVQLAALGSYRYPGVEIDSGPVKDALLSTDIRIKRNALEAVEGANTPAAVSLLVEQLVDLRNPWLKEGVIRAIHRMKPSLSVRLANGLSKEPIFAHRAAAVEGLESSDSPETKALVDFMWDDSEPFVRAAVLPARLRDGLANSPAALQAAFDDTSAAVERALMSAAGRTLKRPISEEKDQTVARQILQTLWDREENRSTRELRLGILRILSSSAELQRTALADLLKRAAEDPDARVRQSAGKLGETIGADAEDPAFDLATCREIAAWAEKPRELEATVERPGFPTGRFRIKLDVTRAPRSTWWFAQEAALGHFDGRQVDEIVPADFLRFGDIKPGTDRRYPPVPLGEIGPARFRAGTLALTGMGPDRSDARFFISLVSRPGDFGRYTPLGRVSENFVGVTWNLLPGDRLVRLRPVEVSLPEDRL